MSKIALYTRNILETGTVIVTGDPDDGFPESRLYDRTISLFWKDTVTEAKNFVVDQGATGNLAVDFLAVHRHNFSGANMQWQYSNDNFAADEHDAVTDWNQSDNSQIIKALSSPVTQRYWRVTLSSMANPKCGEIYMSCAREFEATLDAPKLKRISNVHWNRSIGGLERSTKMGDVRRARSYSLFLVSTDLDEFRAAMAELDEYSKPFYLKDHDGNYFLVRITDDIVENYDHAAQRTRIQFNTIEEL